MRIAGITPESIVDGPGVRYVVFTQGCPHRCRGCHNPSTHDFGGGIEITPEELAARFLKEAGENPLLSGVTISGGEPLIQARELLPLAEAARGVGLDLWLYTGYTIDEIASRGDVYEARLLKNVNALVDGRFEEKLRTFDAHYIGSLNQRIFEVKTLYKHTM
jgi:anaerobic ribonucleoside-triphosphate reductase activating protein